MLTRTISSVASGRPSARMPGISPGRSRPREGLCGRRRRFGVRGTAPLSSFGARLRSRWPQYGHSVMYGLTSARQFLQTTKRSGLPAISDRFYGRGDVLRPSIVIEGAVAALPLELRGAVALVQQVRIRVRLVLRGRLQPVQQFLEILGLTREGGPQILLGRVLLLVVVGPD